MKENGASGLRAKTHKLFGDMVKRGEPFWFYKTYGSQFSRPGVPDFIVCYSGQFGALELKSTGETPAPKQVKELHDIRRAKGHEAWTDSMDGVREFVAELQRRSGAIQRAIDVVDARLPSRTAL